MLTWWLSLGLSLLAGCLIVAATLEWRWRKDIEETFWARTMTKLELGKLMVFGKPLAQSRARFLLRSFDWHLPKEEYIFMYNAVMATINLLRMEGNMRKIGWMPDVFSEQTMKKLVDRALKGAYKLADGHFWDTLIELRQGLTETDRTEMWGEEYWRKLASALIFNPRQEGFDAMRPHLWALRRGYPEIAEFMAENFARKGNYRFLLDLYQDPSAIPRAHLEAVSDVPQGTVPWDDLLDVRHRLGQWDRIASSVPDISDDAMRGRYLDVLRASGQLPLVPQSAASRP